MGSRAAFAQRTAEKVFFVLLFVYTALGACNLTYGKPVITYVMYPTYILGGCLICARLLRVGRYRTMPLLLCAVLMWASYVFSGVMNLSYVTKKSFVYLILWSFYFFLVYTRPGDEPQEELLRDFRRASALFAAWTAALAAISFYMLATGYGWAYRDPNNNDYEVASGFFAGRLWGAFQDPIIGSNMCCAVIAMCVYWFRRHKNGWLRAGLVLLALAMLFYIAMSDSRNGMLCLGVVCAVYVLFWWFGRERERRGALAVLGLALAAAALVCAVLIPKAVQTGYNGLAALDGLRPVDRGYDVSGDLGSFSNRRLDEWGSAVELGLSRPLTGVSFTGVVPYALEHLPETYIVNNDYWITNTLESEVFNIFAAQGFPGVLILLAWFALAVRMFFRDIRLVPRRLLPELALMTALVCEFIVSALFQGLMFYQQNPDTILFWLCFGDLLYLLAAARAAHGSDTGWNEKKDP